MLVESSPDTHLKLNRRRPVAHRQHRVVGRAGAHCSAMTDSHATAITALREAASALGAGRDSSRADGRLPDAERPDIAGAVAVVLDALIGLLRSVDDEA